MMEWQADEDGLMGSNPLSNNVRYKAEPSMRFRDLVGREQPDGTYKFKRDSWYTRMRRKFWLKLYWFRWHLARKMLNLLQLDGEDFCTCDEDY